MSFKKKGDVSFKRIGDECPLRSSERLSVKKKGGVPYRLDS